MLKLEYGDALIIYSIGTVNSADTIDRLKDIIPYVGNEDIRTQMSVLQEKINEMNDEEWEILFPKILRKVAVYLYRDKEHGLN